MTEPTGRDRIVNENTRAHKTVPFGDLVVEAFDRAALHSIDSREISRQARQALGRLLERGREGTAHEQRVLVELSNY